MTTIAWLVPDLIDGSGGHRTILQNAHHLRQQGYRTRIHLERSPASGIKESPADVIRRMFGYGMDDVSVGWTDVPPCDILVATAWHSARFVRDARQATHKVYFVQDLESQFAPAGYFQLIAENSYKYGLVPITIGNWLKHELHERFGSNSFSFDFCADLDVYRPVTDTPRELAICFVHQPEKPRRASNLGLEALSIVKRKNPSVQIYTYGSTTRPQTAVQHEDLGLLDLGRCNALYNRCSIGFCISATNPSRIPFEMMAAGLPVLELHRTNTIYDLPDSATLLCEQTPESLAEGMLALLEDRERLESMSRSGIAYMRDRDMQTGLDQVAKAFEWIANSTPGSQPDMELAEPVYHLPPVTASDALAVLAEQVLPPGTPAIGPWGRRRNALKQKAAALFGRRGGGR